MANNFHAQSFSSPLPPPPPSHILAISSESHVHLQEPNEQMEPQPTKVAFAKRPRGRPPGSKNKPKPAIEFPIPSTFILQERDDFLKPVVLIVPAGIDIVNAIISFSRDRDVSILVHHASGTISEVNLCTPLSPSGDLSFKGNLHMVSLTGFYTKCLSPVPPKNIPFSFFNIQFSRGGPPQLFGGLVGHKLIAAEPVQVTASIIKKHKYHKVVCPITNPSVQPGMNSTGANRYVAIVNNDINGITNNTANHPGFSVGASTSSQTNV